jgi:hypothetical protein
MNNTGRFQFYRGNQSTVLGTSTNSIALGTNNYIELKVTFHGSAGSYELRVNGINWLSGTGLNTIATGNAFANCLQFETHFSNSYGVDDLYLMNDTGTVNNDFAGDVRVQCIYPNGAGNYTGFTANTGTNWQAVDETAHDGDTTYVFSDVAGTRDSYNFQDLAGSATRVCGVQRMASARKDDAGSRLVKTFYRSGGVDYDSASTSLGTTYNYSIDILETNPATSSEWTVTDINNAEFGIKVEA